MTVKGALDTTKGATLAWTAKLRTWVVTMLPQSVSPVDRKRDLFPMLQPAAAPISSAVEFVSSREVMPDMSESNTTQYFVPGFSLMPLPEAVKELMPALRVAGLVSVPTLLPGTPDESDQMLTL